MKLSFNQSRLGEEYLVDLTATQAAIRAGYSARTARSIGQENPTKLYIQAATHEVKALQFSEMGFIVRPH